MSYLKIIDYSKYFIFYIVIIFSLNFICQDYFVDDAYISFHYAKNISNDFNFYYNAGETGPIGYTNPLYLIILSTIHLLSFKSLSFEIISRILSNLSILIIIIILSINLKDLSDKNNFKKFYLHTFYSLLLFFLFPYFLPNIYSGMETAILCVTILIIFYHTLIKSLNRWIFITAFIIASTIRFDTIFVLFPFLVTYFIIQIKLGSKKDVLDLLYSFIPIILFYAIHYFITKTFLPLSYNHKASSFSIDTLISYLELALITQSPLIFLLFIKKVYRPIILCVISISIVALFYSFFSHWHFERYFFPYAFAAFFLMLIIVIKSYRTNYVFTTFILFLFSIILFPSKTSDGYSFVSGYRVGLKQVGLVGNVLKRSNLNEEYRTFACYDAGILSYNSKWKILDLAGLTTKEIFYADNNPIQIIEKYNPTVLILNSLPELDKKGELFFQNHKGLFFKLPNNYTLIKSIRLTNKYWQASSKYGYYIYVNSNANDKLVNDLLDLDYSVEEEIGIQRSIYYIYKNLNVGHLFLYF